MSLIPGSVSLILVCPSCCDWLANRIKSGPRTVLFTAQNRRSLQQITTYTFHLNFKNSLLLQQGYITSADKREHYAYNTVLFVLPAVRVESSEVSSQTRRKRRYINIDWEATYLPGSFLWQIGICMTSCILKLSDFLPHITQKIKEETLFKLPFCWKKTFSHSFFDVHC